LDEIRARLAQVGDFWVRLPDIPDDVRETLLRMYLPGQRTTDPRLALELFMRGDAEIDFDPDLPNHASAALRAAGFCVGDPVGIGEHRRQGDGSYAVLVVDGIELSVCGFGRFARSDATTAPAVIAALETAGFRWIDDRLGSVIFEGLAVYFFGRREPLMVSDLLFYWQD
jgi:hypothetical protein